MKFLKRLFPPKEQITEKFSVPQAEKVNNSENDFVTIHMKLPKISKVILPKSKLFENSDVQEFERVLLRCSNCTDNCKSIKLARSIVKTGLDEFVHQKKENCLPVDIDDALNAMGIHLIMSPETDVAIYDKLWQV